VSFPRYPEYKDSGVEWLGEVPSHWTVLPVKNLAQIVNGYPFDSALFDPSEGTPLVRIRDLGKSETEARYKGMYIDSAAITAEDVLIGMDGDFNVGRWRGDVSALLNQRMCCVRGHSAEITRFLEYALPVPLRVMNDVTYSTTVKHLASSQVEKTRVAIPRRETDMRAIVEFLDRETAKIDALVSEQRRLMELLKEKRQAVISHAVTKGLNPDAPMKPSGIKWLGVVPENWTVTVIKRFATLQRGHDLTDAERTEGPYPVVTSSGPSGTHGSFIAHAPGVVTGRYGSTGRLFYITENYWPHNTALYVKDFHSNNARYVWYQLQSVDFAAHSAKAAVPGIDRNDIHVLPVAVPPINEQRAIVEYLVRRTASLDALGAQVTNAIFLLLERRTALISAAVTDQIDVRSLATSEAA